MLGCDEGVEDEHDDAEWHGTDEHEADADGREDQAEHLREHGVFPCKGGTNPPVPVSSS